MLPSDLLPLLPAHVARVLACSPGTWDNAGTWRALWRGLPVQPVEVEGPWEGLPRQLKDKDVLRVRPIPDGTGDMVLSFAYPLYGVQLARVDAQLNTLNRVAVDLCEVLLSPRGTRFLCVFANGVQVYNARTLCRYARSINATSPFEMRFVDEDHVAVFSMNHAWTIHIVALAGGDIVRTVYLGAHIRLLPACGPMFISRDCGSMYMADRLWSLTDPPTELHSAVYIQDAAMAGNQLHLISDGAVVVKNGPTLAYADSHATLVGDASGRLLIFGETVDVLQANARTLRLKPPLLDVVFDHDGLHLLVVTTQGALWRVPC